MIDLHCHILPGVDDGAQTTADSIALGRALLDAGVHTVAATPHLRDDHPAVVITELAERCESLSEELANAGVKLSVVCGGEVDLLWALEASPESLRLATYGQRGKDLLLETPYGPLPPNFEGHIERLQERGFRILLAHPERSPTFQATPERLTELVGRGVLTQLTVGSLVPSPHASRSAKLAHRMLQDGLVHVIASDAHGAAGSIRPPAWDALQTARDLVGDRADWMVDAVPRAILDGTPLPPPPALPETREGGRLERFFRKRDT